MAMIAWVAVPNITRWAVRSAVAFTRFERPRTSMIDLLYLAHGRSRFTAASLKALRQNTNLDLVRLIFCTDGAHNVSGLITGLAGFGEDAQVPALLDTYPRGG